MDTGEFMRRLAAASRAVFHLAMAVTCASVVADSWRGGGLADALAERVMDLVSCLPRGDAAVVSVAFCAAFLESVAEIGTLIADGDRRTH